MLKKITPLSFILLLSIVGLSQSSNLEKRAAFSFTEYENGLLNKDVFFSTKASEMGLSTLTQFKLTKEIPGEVKHYRYKQYYKDIPVYGLSYILHERNGKITHSNGSYLPQIELSTTPRIDGAKAIEIAMHHMQIETYENTPKPSLYIIDTNYPQASNEYKLAYVFELESKQAAAKNEYIIDAHTGGYITSFSKIFDIGVEGKGLTSYYGEKSFITDSIGPGQYMLHDPTRGDGITTLTDASGSSQELEDEDNYWDYTDTEHGTSAIDVHWGTQKFWDMLVNKLNWEGLDNNGKSMNPIVEILGGSDFVNAQWNGENAVFGNGDCHHNPLTSLDVVGHEFTHGIIEETAGLIPFSESGAINESICDVLGKCLEYYEDPDNFTWYLGQTFLNTPFAFPFRNMSDPHEFNDPKFYQGEYWFNCGTIHYNAGVGNYWFYLLAQGGSGVNEIGETYSIPALGIETAMEIVFSTMSSYLTENSRYYEYYLASLQATEDLFGEGAAEIAIVRDAWNAVGVKEGVTVISGISLIVDFDNDFQSTVNFFCEDGAFYQDTVLIINTGTKDYTANLFAELKLAIGANSFYLPIDKDIPAGDTLVFPINDIVTIDFDGKRNLFASIEFDQNQVECLPSVVVVLQNSKITEPDVRITATYKSTACQDDQGLTYVVRLNNTSCLAIPNQTDYTVYVYDLGVLIFQETYDTFLEIAQGSFTSFSLELDYNLLSGEDLDVLVEMDGDVDPNNNMTTLNFIKAQETVKSEYLNTFTTEINPTNQLKYDKRTLITEPVEYLGESYFAASAYYENPDVGFCMDPTEYFIGGLSRTGKTAQLSMCVNLEGYSSSMLKFDLIQFRNDSFQYQDLFENSVMKVFINGENQFDEELIYDLEEGEKYSFSYNLENNFNGNIILQFFNWSGTLPSNPDFFEYDVFLLDNLEIEEGVTDVEDLNHSSFAEVFPNPSADNLQLLSTKEIKYISIINTQGQSVSRINNREQRQEIITHDLDSGYYFLNIVYADKSRESIPFIKIKNQ